MIDMITDLCCTESRCDGLMISGLALIVGLVLILLGLLAYLLLLAIDQGCAVKYSSSAVVIGKTTEYSAPSYAGVDVGDVMVANPIGGGTDYIVVARITDLSAAISEEVVEAEMSRKEFFQVEKGDEIRVVWGVGSLFKKAFIIGAEMKEVT